MPHDDSATAYRGAVPPLRLTMIVVAVWALAVAPSAMAAPSPVSQTWHGNQIRLYDAQRAGFFGAGITVAVLDGWVDRSHPDFGGRALAGADCASGTCSTTITKDSCGQHHGTHVAGTVASTSYGVAGRARLLPIRVLKDDGTGDCTGDPKGVAAGIDWAVAHGAHVLNLSLGPDVPGLASSSAIPQAVKRAANAGRVVVFSAGNADLPVAQAYGDDALVVAATGPSGRLASYSQHGEGVSVAAPGGEPTGGTSCSQAVCITSVFPGGQYAVAAGTSMAAPHVAGLAALLLGQNPNRGRADVLNKIMSTAHPLSGAGAGLVDAAAALGVPRTAPKPRATATRAPVVKPRASAPPVVKPAAPKPVVVIVKPSPVLPRKAAPSASPSASPTPAAVVNTAGRSYDREQELPAPLVGLAGALIGLAAISVLVLPRLARR